MKTYFIFTHHHHYYKYLDFLCVRCIFHSFYGTHLNTIIILKLLTCLLSKTYDIKHSKRRVQVYNKFRKCFFCVSLHTQHGRSQVIFLSWIFISFNNVFMSVLFVSMHTDTHCKSHLSFSCARYIVSVCVCVFA